MLYHDHHVLIKPYQIYVLEQWSREAGASTLMSQSQYVCLMNSFEQHLILIWVKRLFQMK